MKDLVEKKGVLGWFASNHVAANLLMFFIIASGILSIVNVKKEIFPEYSVDMITVSVEYLGATPSDVEDGVLLRIEEAVEGIEGVKKVNASAVEGMGTVVIEVEEYSDISEVLDDVKAEVDRIITFPEETEKPVIAEVKTINQVITAVVHGNIPERSLKELAEEIRDDLTMLDEISQVQVAGLRPYEISVEVSEETLRKYKLTFEQIANAIRRGSLDLPAGQVKTSGGEILIRTQAQKYYGKEFEKIVVLTATDGTEIRLGDIATVKDGFEDIDLYTKFDGEPAALIQVFRIGKQGAIEVADAVKEYVEEKSSSLPKGVKIDLWEDNSAILQSRIDLLVRNARLGLVLVFICLTLFLDLRLAFWTTMGIPISFMGAFWLMPMFGVSINMISLFAFIMTLGIVVDDAIVVGENIFNYQQQGLSRVESAIKGVKEMAAPVTLAVLTTMFAFIPLAYTLGIMGKILRVLPIIVISVLSISLVEALLILPAHLSGKDRLHKTWLFKLSSKLTTRTEGMLQRFINNKFTRMVEFCVKWRYATLAFALALLIFCVGFITNGYIKFVFFDAVDADNIVVSVEMPQGVPVEKTEAVVERIESTIDDLRAEFDKYGTKGRSVIKHVATTIGSQPSVDGGPTDTGGASSGSHLAMINVELLGGEERNVSSITMKNRWRDLIGEIAGVSSLTFLAEIMSTGKAIDVELSHKDFDISLAASEDLKKIVAEYPGVSDIADSFVEGKSELKLSLTEQGRTLGIELDDLARQVRQGFYGEQAQRIQRGRDDIRVMVRYPQEKRESIGDVENMRIRLADGTEIPFAAVAKVDFGRSYSAINRVDGRRVINVSADIDEAVANSTEVNKDLYSSVLPELAKKYPGLSFRASGEVEARNESLSSLVVNFPLALLAIYGLLAVQFRSYIQPVIVMSAIPFGIVGATFGHLLLGYNLSILSLFGIVALSGVVVNDSLIMIDLINRERAKHIKLHQILRDCATRRFRPIMLTTLTTFIGLAPMMAERALQARFLIPMAISLAFGVLFATCITLLLVPSLYMILEDIKSRFSGKPA